MIIENLTKENFWNEMEEKYSLAMEKFHKWINEYKKENNWDKLFNTTELPSDYMVEAPKFHDLPFAIQMGIFMQFQIELDGDLGICREDGMYSIKACLCIINE